MAHPPTPKTVPAMSVGLLAGATLLALAALATGSGQANAAPPRTPTATPLPPLPALDGGSIYVDRDLPPAGFGAGDVMVAFQPDGSNETVVSAMVEEAYYGMPSTRLHDGRRWFIRQEPVAPEDRFPGNGSAREIFAYEELSGTRIQLTQLSAAGIEPCCGMTYWAADALTGAPDGAMAWSGRKWVDDDNDGVLDRVDLAQSGIFVARLAFDGSGGLALVSQPASASVRVSTSTTGTSLGIADFAISPDGMRVAYSTDTGRDLKVANIPSADPSTHVTVFDWAGAQMDWSVGSPGKLAFSGCSVRKKGNTETPQVCGIYSVNADGSNPQLLLTPKAATSSDPVFTNIGWTKWSPNASHLILFEKVWQENGFSNILLGTKLRRITADGRDNTVLKTDGYFPIDWVTNSDILH